MRRGVVIVLVALMVLLPVACQAKTVTVEKVVEKQVTVLAPTAKPAKPIVIDVVIEDIVCPDATILGGACAKYWASEFMKTHPGTIVNVTMLGDGSGSTAQLDAMMVAGYPVNVYQAYGGRVSAYRDMLALLPYKASRYVHPAVDPWVQGDKIVWYPSFAWAVGMYANTTLAEQLGVASLLPQDGDRTWTLAQFEAFAEAVKAKSTPQKPLYSAALSLASAGGDYWMHMWMFAFGAKLYKLNNDGSTNFKALDVQSPQWIEALNWLKKGHDKGWFLPNPETLAYAAIAAEFQANKVVIGYGSGASYMADNIGKQTWISYPSPEGKFVPFATGPTGIAVFDTAKRLEALKAQGKKVTDAQIAEAKAKDTAAVEFATWLDANYTQVQVDNGKHPWRTDITPKWANPNAAPAAGPTLAPTPAVVQARFASEQRWQKARIDKYGLTDIGTASPYYSPLREIMWKNLGEFFAGKADAAKCLANIDTQFNALVNK